MISGLANIANLWKQANQPNSPQPAPHQEFQQSQQQSPNSFGTSPYGFTQDTPVRDTFEGLGYQVGYDNASGNVSLYNPQSQAMAQVGRDMYSNQNGRTYIDRPTYDSLLRQTGYQAPRDEQVQQQQQVPERQQQQFNPMEWFQQQNAGVSRGLQSQAGSQAQNIANQQREAINALISQLRSSEESALRRVDSGVKDAEQELEDRTFQNYLSSRAAMSGRGLSGSGFASDQDTRLQLARQRDLAGIHRDAADNRFDVSSQFGHQISDAERQLSQINPAELEAQIFQDLYSQAQSGINDQAAMMMEWMKHTTPSGNTLANTEADMAKAMLPYQGMTQQQQAQFGLDQQKLGLDQQRLGLDQQRALWDQENTMLDQAWREFEFGNIPASKRAELENAFQIAANRDATSFGIAQMNNETRLQTTQMNNSTQLSVAEMNNVTKLQQTEMNINQQMRKIEATQWDQASKQMASQANEMFKGAKVLLDQMNNTADESERASILNTYNAMVNQANQLLSGAQQNTMGSAPDFSSMPKGDGKKFTGRWQSATRGNYSNYNKMNSHANANPEKYKSTANTMKKALEATGTSVEWLGPLLELTARESSWNPSAQNPSSTAYGLFQFLDSTWKNYGHKKTSDPYQQTIAGIDYVKKRYGDPWKALAFWDQNNWY